MISGKSRRASFSGSGTGGIRNMILQLKVKYLTDRHIRVMDYISMRVPRLCTTRSRLRLMVPATFLILLYSVGAVVLHYHSGNIAVARTTKRIETKRLNITLVRLPKMLIEPSKEKACNRNVSAVKTDPVIATVPVTYYTSTKHKLQVCSVPKVGSTFLTALMAIVNEVTQNLTALDVLSLSKREINRKFDEILKVDVDAITRNYSGQTIVPARNPYSRLYSAYIERVYLSNDWLLGVNIKRLTKSKTDQNSDPRTICADGVTFTEFLRYITRKSNAYLDPQWAPITSLCKICDHVKVNLLREETFAEDLDKLFSKKKFLKRDVLQTIKVYLKPNSKTEILSEVATQLNIGFESQSQYCISRNEVLQRIWKALQLRGHIGKSQSLPKENYKGAFTNAHAKIRFKHDLLKVLDEGASPGKYMAQRNAILAGVYNSINADLIRAIQRIYADDFELLGYSTTPPK